ncbi:MAG: glucose-6-phosphate dehydrogenase, partial [Pseudomonadota bacterium]
MVSRVIPVDPFDLVIFGGTGDLARRKILPGLFRRFCAGQMDSEARVIGAARSDMEAAAYRDFVRAAIVEFEPTAKTSPEGLEAFLDCLDYVRIDAKGVLGWPELVSLLPAGRIRAFYFSVAPSLFGDLAERLEENGLACDMCRVVVEKPFGRDLET